MPHKPNIALVIPCYNEEARLDTGAYTSFLSRFPVDVYFVDDGSRDNTRAVLDRLQSAHPDQVRVVVLENNRGKAEAVRQGVLASLDAGHPLVGYFDADLSTPLDAALELADSLKRDGVKLVMGSRVKMMGRDISRRAVRHYLSRIFSTIVCLILGMNFYDTQCGAKLFVNTAQTRRIFSFPFQVGWTFDVELIWRFYLAFAAPGFNPEAIMREYPLMVWRDVAGSKVSYRDAVKIAKELVRLHRLTRDAAYPNRLLAEPDPRPWPRG